MPEIHTETKLKVVGAEDLEKQVEASLHQEDPNLEEGMQRILSNIVHTTDEVNVIPPRSD
jgi:hypothetical protein